MNIGRVLLGVCFVASAAVDTDLPSPAPTIAGVFPHGAQRGKTTDVVLSGQNLHEAQSVEFAGRGVKAEILSSLGAEVKLRVAVDATAEVGRRDFRFTTAKGAYVGVFDLGALPEINETENNDMWRKPQPITLPVLVNGVIGSEDWDHFQFHAKAGETLVFDVSAARHGSRLDADLAILDSRGVELAWVDDTTIFGDPHLEYTFEAEGDYIVRVGSLTGGPNADYRLSVGLLPYVSKTLPAGLSTGRTTAMTLTGTHLDLVDEVWIGDHAVKGKILRKDSRSIQASFAAPAGLKPGPTRIHASQHGLEVAIPTELRITDVPEFTPSKPALTLASAPVIAPSTVLNGVIETPKSSHYFRFSAKAGESYVFRAESMKLGYHLDPTITLFDQDGKKLAYADDPGMDDRADENQLDPDLSYRIRKDGTYYVSIRDGMYRGGEQLVYRLSVLRTPPDFIVELREPVKSTYQGQSGTLQVRIRRRAGWDAPVEVWAEGMPEGFAVERKVAEPKDSVVKDTCGVNRDVDGTIVLLPFHADRAVGHFDLRIKARGVMEGATVEHAAILCYPYRAAGLMYGPMQVQKAEVNVAAAPSVILGVADKVSVVQGREGQVKVTLRRFGAVNTDELLIRAKRAPDGMVVAPIQVSAGAKTVAMTIKAEAGASGGPVVLEAVSPAGSSLGESVPFRVEVK